MSPAAGLATTDAELEGIARCRSSIARNSKSFALASRLLPGDSADEAAIVYAWCRRADDAVDHAPLDGQAAALAQLRAELEQVYAGAALEDPELEAFQRVALDRRIPAQYPGELLDGMEMDCRGERYETLDHLLLYCHRVAGVVGLMVCPVLGLQDARALRNAAHMGIAMQLTNICRDVLEDWDMGRLYVPGELLAECGLPGLSERLGSPFPIEARDGMARAVRRLLREADRYYASGDRGLPALPLRSSFAVRAARRIYAEIGRRVERQGCDVLAGRAIVPLGRKLVLVARAAAGCLGELPGRALASREAPPPAAGHVVRFPDDVLPLEPRPAS